MTASERRIDQPTEDEVIDGQDLRALPISEAISYLMKVGGIDEDAARQIVLIERGEWPGDRQAVE